MTWLRLYEVIKGLAALSGIVAFMSLAINVYKDVQLKAASEKQAWLEANVYSIVSDAGADGIKENEIIAKFRESNFLSNVELGKDDLKTDSLNRVIISLRSKNAVTVQNDQSIALLMTPKEALKIDLLNGRGVYLQDYVLGLVSNDPGKYTWKDLQSQLLKEKGASNIEVARTLAALRMFFKYDKENKLEMLEFVFAPPFMPMPPPPATAQ